MIKYIGMDAHSSICVFSVVDENGTEVNQHRFSQSPNSHIFQAGQDLNRNVVSASRHWEG